MFGVLLDVSGSMQEAFEVHYNRYDQDHDVKKSHAIVTSLTSIVNQEITTYQRNESLFACAFGLDTYTCNGIDTCDLVALLENQLPFNILSEILRKQKQKIEQEKYNIQKQLLQIEKQKEEQHQEKNKCERDLQRIKQQRLEQQQKRQTDGHKLLIQFACDKGASHAENWIKECLSNEEAGILYDALRNDSQLTKQLIPLIPSSAKYYATKVFSTISFSSVRDQVQSHETLQLTHQNIKSKESQEQREYELENMKLNQQKSYHSQKYTQLGKEKNYYDKSYTEKSAELAEVQEKIKQQQVTIGQKPKPRAVKDISDMMNTLLNQQSPSSSEVEKIIDSIKPYIYGGTPMVKALKDAKEIFDADTNSEINPKILFVLSDGESADGDPTCIAQELQQSNVTIATCYLTSESIPNPKRLVDEEDPSWSEGACILYRMSSSMPNTNAPVTHLVDYGWELPLSGDCHLFVLANSLDVVEEFCKVAVSQLTHGTDALVHMLGRLSLAEYINQSNDDFKAQQQIGATCYANAIAAVFHLAMHRIVDREGGIPGFKAIRSHIIREYGKEGANTEMVVKSVSSEYRLKCHVKINEEDARKAINERRPVVARFSWKGKQEEMFKKFYERSPKAILRANDITVEESSQIAGGHAVVLIRCHPNCLVFMNSWGQAFGDGGFFRVENEKVLHNMEFFDVYWDEDDLTPSEKVAFEKKGVDEWKEFLKKFKSIQDLSYVCPHCKEGSKVDEFTGHHLEAKCPKCLQIFKPDGPGILESLYLHSR